MEFFPVRPRGSEQRKKEGRHGDAPAVWFPLVLTQHKPDRRARSRRSLTYSPSSGPPLALYHQSHFVAVSFPCIQGETIISESRRGTARGGSECAGGFPSGMKCVNERSPPSPTAVTCTHLQTVKGPVERLGDEQLPSHPCHSVCRAGSPSHSPWRCGW